MEGYIDFDYDYSEVSLEEGFNLWKENFGIRKKLPYLGKECIGEVVSGPHWTGVWDDTKGVCNCGTHYILPASREARSLINEFIVNEWIGKYGLLFNQAKALLKSLEHSY